MDSGRLTVMSVVGARPQFVKLAPVHHAFSESNIEHLVVHTGQHYDEKMSGAFFKEFDLPLPDHHLEVGSHSHGRQTGLMLDKLEVVFERTRPDWVLVYGDTNSTLAAALAAVKLHLPTAHLEAGLRSRNRSMPEEHNRILTDHCCDLLLAPNTDALANLGMEGLGDRAVDVGDVMVDVCRRTREAIPDTPSGALENVDPYVVATVHRAENTDDAIRLRAIVDSLRRLSLRVVLVVHPRLAARARSFGIDLTGGALMPVEPLSYSRMVAAVVRARGVVTDSGGLQKEAVILETPCTTLRPETEWEETLAEGWNVLDPEAAHLEELAARPAPIVSVSSSFGDGRAAERVVRELESRSAG